MTDTQFLETISQSLPIKLSFLYFKIIYGKNKRFMGSEKNNMTWRGISMRINQNPEFDGLNYKMTGNANINKKKMTIYPLVHSLIFVKTITIHF